MTERQLEGRRAAVMIGPLFEDVEATYPYHRLREAGASVELIGVAADTALKGKKGEELRTDSAAADVIADDLDVLVIAGGFGPDKLRTDAGVKKLVREMNDAGKPIAFICHAGWVPVSAGIVDGRRVTSYPTIADDLRNAGAEWEDAEVVVDGNFVSSRRPDDLPAFMRALIEVAVGAEEVVGAR
ncbi:MAG: type 1 glutamine amidotransferase domain-containing protein [Microbacterium sp.]|uniref:type 1 glutamine amidotransferase domain-containing protein n=1 Tax=Microbacterium sp. TaxID=51671 RepID=UPI003D6F5921